MKIALTHEPATGRLIIAMAENCHGDSTPPVAAVHFDGIRQPVAPDIAALAAAIVASRWCGEVLKFAGFAIGVDAADAVRRIVEDVRYVQPVDGYRRKLCEGQIDLFVAPAAEACAVLGMPRAARKVSRLVTWSGEFVDPVSRSSTGGLAGEVSTNADLVIPMWEVSVCLGLLAGGPALGAIVVPEPDAAVADDFARLAGALRILGVRLVVAGAGLPARESQAPARRARKPVSARAVTERA